MEKVVLAYSGGLDTSVAIKWLIQDKKYEVIAVILDVGQDEDFESIKEKALNTGASEALVVDAKDEFLAEYAFRALKANALYEGKYPLISSLSRPLIAKHMVKVAREKKATALAHGCTGKGNDQVRLESAFAALSPDLEVIAPVREWAMSRMEEIEYARKHNIPVKLTKENPYSIDENIWGRAVECGVLEDPWEEPPSDIYVLTKIDESKVSDEIIIGFEEGKPISLNGDNIGFFELISMLNKIIGPYGFGRVDMIENRLVGIKSREIYEAPAALALIMAHSDLEYLTLERDLHHYKRIIEEKYAELIYYGHWFSPLREALDAFISETQKFVNGEVRLKVVPGDCSVTGRRSKNSLYQYKLATYEQDDQFKHSSSKGFIDIFTLPVKVWANSRKNKRL